MISAPSGAGKSSLVKQVCKKDTKIQVSISHTTRGARTGEINAQDYYFVTIKQFEEMLAKQEFLEYAKVYDNYYGTNHATIQNFLNKGKDIILEIDWQGAKQIKKLLPEAILIYILPPNLKELEKRLKNRNTDNEATIKKRLDLAAHDISYANEFDFIVINDNFSQAVDDLYSIIRVHRLKTNRVLDDYKSKNNLN